MYIFPRVSLQTLYFLRRVSRSWNCCVAEYFRVCQSYDFTDVGTRFNVRAFRIALGRNVAVRQLILRNNRDWLVDGTLEPVLQANTRLTKLTLTRCSTLTSLTALTMATCCPSLRELDLSCCHWLESEQFGVLVCRCQGMEMLSVSGCWNLNDDAIMALADSCKRFGKVVLTGLMKINKTMPVQMFAVLMGTLTKLSRFKQLF